LGRPPAFAETNARIVAEAPSGGRRRSRESDCAVHWRLAASARSIGIFDHLELGARSLEE
jgi:hypothetical protein